MTWTTEIKEDFLSVLCFNQKPISCTRRTKSVFHFEWPALESLRKMNEKCIINCMWDKSKYYTEKKKDLNAKYNNKTHEWIRYSND